MIYQDSVLVQLIRLVERIPSPEAATTPPSRTTLSLLPEALYEGLGDHDRQKVA